MGYRVPRYCPTCGNVSFHALDNGGTVTCRAFGYVDGRPTTCGAVNVALPQNAAPSGQKQSYYLR